jgi:hypothetical protein
MPTAVAPRRRAALPGSASIDLLGLDERVGALVDRSRRLGIRTLGELAALPRAKVADRFGVPGITHGARARRW